MKALSIFAVLALAALCLGAGIKVSRKHRRLLASLLFLVMASALVGAELLAKKHYEWLGTYAFFAVCACGLAGWFFSKPPRAEPAVDPTPDEFGEYGNAEFAPGLGSTSVDEGYRARAAAEANPQTNPIVQYHHSYQDSEGNDVPLGT